MQAILGLGVIVAIGAAVAGYVMNIVKLIGLLMVPGAVEFTGELIARLLGLIPIFGIFVGWF